MASTRFRTVMYTASPMVPYPFVLVCSCRLRLETLRSEFQNFNSILLNRQQSAPYVCYPPTPYKRINALTDSYVLYSKSPITQQSRQSILELEATSRLIQRLAFWFGHVGDVMLICMDRYEHDWQDIHDRNAVNFEKARVSNLPWWSMLELRDPF